MCSSLTVSAVLLLLHIHCQYTHSLLFTVDLFWTSTLFVPISSVSGSNHGRHMTSGLQTWGKQLVVSLHWLPPMTAHPVCGRSAYEDAFSDAVCSWEHRRGQDCLPPDNSCVPSPGSAVSLSPFSAAAMLLLFASASPLVVTPISKSGAPLWSIRADVNGFASGFKPAVLWLSWLSGKRQTSSP